VGLLVRGRLLRLLRLSVGGRLLGVLVRRGLLRLLVRRGLLLGLRRLVRGRLVLLR